MSKINAHGPVDSEAEMISSNQRMVTIDKIAEATRVDETLSEIIDHIKEGHSYLPSKVSRFNGYRQIFSEMSVSQTGILLHNDLIVIPPALAPRMVKLAHRCHVGINSTRN